MLVQSKKIGSMVQVENLDSYINNIQLIILFCYYALK